MGVRVGQGPIADEETAPFQTEGKGGFSRVEKDNRKSAKAGSCRFAESVGIDDV